MLFLLLLLLLLFLFLFLFLLLLQTAAFNPSSHPFDISKHCCCSSHPFASPKHWQALNCSCCCCSCCCSKLQLSTLRHTRSTFQNIVVVHHTLSPVQNTAKLQLQLLLLFLLLFLFLFLLLYNLSSLARSPFRWPGSADIWIGI